ncbi:hypothetical protein GA0115240_16143 [Streptomyces sp. DvalAA-14]|uniref:hypothetical protein n=1 Tax=unclassified Streptomyces TaxID=2593676 RepID=UPI00081B4C70|nr:MULTISPECIES: hypothetical protein [unclassified Streptomyces]MYS24221.1 hypothetical protein [Streptomyces sp. SID4948]SCE43864.1 hypothetical protein GA0115240_16143 [Streptomyces sp. DvalAA-14]
MTHAPRPQTDAAQEWTGRASNRMQWVLAAAGAACLALGIDLAVDGPGTSGLAPLVMSVVGCLAVGLLVLFGTVAFTHVHVRIDYDAVHVRCGHIGLPRRRIPLEDVSGAEVDALISPRTWGGWGYRWRPELGTAVVVRRGPGVVIELGGGRHFTVTVDDPEGAVRTIRDCLRLRGVGRPATGAGA